MTVTEQLWFVVGIAGFLLIMEGAITFLARSLARRVPEDILKVIAGLVIFALALIKLLNLPPLN